MQQDVFILSTEVDNILGIIDQYYRQFDLELVELAIGNRQSKYMTLGKRYADWEAFSKATNHGSAFDLNDVTTFFDLWQNLEGNKDWTILKFLDYDARYTLFADDKFLEFLSRELDTKVVKYQEVRVASYYAIDSYDKGILEGNIVWGDDNYASGIFEKYNKEDSKETWKALNPYFSNLKLDLDLYHIKKNYDQQCRRFLLKGEPLALFKYLKIENMGTLDLNPLKGL